MKTRITVTICTIALSLHAFPRGPVKTGVVSDTIWTNADRFIWLSGQPNPTSSPGPSFFFTESGSLLQGTNVFQDVNLNDGRFHALQATVMTDSNEPPSIVVNLSATDSENYSFYSFQQTVVKADKDTGNAMFDMVSWTTNGSNSEITFFTDPSDYAGGSYLLLMDQGINLFKADHGMVRALNGFESSSKAGLTTNVTIGSVTFEFTGGILTSVQ